MALFECGGGNAIELKNFVADCVLPTLPSAGGFSFSKNQGMLVFHNDAGSSRFAVSIPILSDDLALSFYTDFGTATAHAYVTDTDITGSISASPTGDDLGVVGQANVFAYVHGKKGKYLTFDLPYQSGGNLYYRVAGVYN